MASLMLLPSLRDTKREKKHVEWSDRAHDFAKHPFRGEVT